MKKTTLILLSGLMLAMPGRRAHSDIICSSTLPVMTYPWNVLDRLENLLLTCYESDLGPYLDHVWPVSGTTTPDFPLSDTYGPRLKTSEGGRYDWHRGIDIPVDLGTPVMAIANGTVRIAGENASYSDPLVQIRHAKPDGSGDYYSQYMHMDSWCVSEGDSVTQGQVIGTSGCSESGFEHIHFEIRDDDLWQKACVHPMSAMPYDDLTAPSVTIDDVDWSDPSAPVVQVTVEVSADELDLRAVEVCVSHRMAISDHRFAYQEVDSQRFDIMLRNFLYTPDGDAGLYLDDADFAAVLAEPAEFSSSSSTWQLTLTFSGLHGVGTASEQAITVYAEDVNGNTDSVSTPMVVALFPIEHFVP